MNVIYTRDEASSPSPSHRTYSGSKHSADPPEPAPEPKPRGPVIVLTAGFIGDDQHVRLNCVW